MLYYVLAFVGGLALTLQIGINAALNAVVGGPVLAAAVSFSVGALGLIAAWGATVLMGIQPVPLLADVLKNSSLWMWLGGLLGGLYVFIVTFTAPKIGFASVLSLVMAGQIILALTLDHFGILTSTAHPISLMRIVGVALLMAGVLLIQNH